MSKQVLGVATIKVNGQAIQSYPGAKLDPGGTVRNPRTGHKYHGFSASEKESTLECTIDLTADVSIDEIRGWDDVTISFETDIGKSYVINNASHAGPPPITDGSDSQVELSFFGPPAEEVG